MQYADSAGVKHVYLLQEPAKTNAAAQILIYMHGGGGQEEQGMKIFPSLRGLLNERGWLFVCPRDNDFGALRAHLRSRYGSRQLILAGASAGARRVYQEARLNPESYSGLILMCAAMIEPDTPDNPEKDLNMPLWIVCGDKDIYVTGSRWLYNAQKAAGRRVHYHEIPGGDHNAPCQLINWKDALDFIWPSTPAKAQPERR